MVAENLICILHEQVHSGDRDGAALGIREGKRRELFEKALHQANEFPVHSFVRQVARWMYDSFQ